MATKRVAVCNRCSRRENFDVFVRGKGLPQDWARVKAKWFDSRGYNDSTREQDWCPSCAGKLLDLFILGNTVVHKAKDVPEVKDAIGRTGTDGTAR